MSGIRRAATLAVLCAGMGLSALASAQSGQPDPGFAPVRIESGSTPAVVRVGDPFRVAVRVSAPPGARVEFPPLPPSSPSVQALDSARVLPDPDTGGASVAVYPLVAWTVGDPALPPLPVRVTRADGASRVYPVRLRLPRVGSVLPADTARVALRGPRDVLGPDRDRALLALVGTLLLVGAALAALLLRRRGGGAPRRPGEIRSARERALAALMELHRSAPFRARDWPAVYVGISGILREFLASRSPAWHPQLTSGELVARMRADGANPHSVATLADVLHGADLVKFARWEPNPAEAEEDWRAAYDWIARFEAAE